MDRDLLLRSKQALEQVLSRPQDIAATARDMFQQADLDGDGSISFEELKGLTQRIMEGWEMDWESMEESSFRESFDALDTDRSQSIDLKEFLPFVKQFLEGSLRYTVSLLEEQPQP